MSEEKIVRKKQLNISTSDMSDEVYQLLNSLADERLLTKRVIEWAEETLSQNQARQRFEVKVYQELALIKGMLRTRHIIAQERSEQLPGVENGIPTVMQVSTNETVSIIEEDVEYDY